MFRAWEMSCEAKKISLGLEVIILSSAKRSLIFLKDFFFKELMIVLDIKQSNQNLHHNFQ